MSRLMRLLSLVLVIAGYCVFSAYLLTFVLFSRTTGKTRNYFFRLCMKVRKTGPTGKASNNSATVWRKITTNDTHARAQCLQRISSWVARRFSWSRQLVGFLSSSSRFAEIGHGLWEREWSFSVGLLPHPLTDSVLLWQRIICISWIGASTKRE